MSTAAVLPTMAHGSALDGAVDGGYLGHSEIGTGHWPRPSAVEAFTSSKPSPSPSPVDSYIRGSTR